MCSHATLPSSIEASRDAPKISRPRAIARRVLSACDLPEVLTHELTEISRTVDLCTEVARRARESCEERNRGLPCLCCLEAFRIRRGAVRRRMLVANVTERAHRHVTDLHRGRSRLHVH